jgi:hypothetical protein
MEMYLNNPVWILCIFLCLATACENNTEPRNYTSISGLYTCQEISPHAGLKKYIVEVDKVVNQESLYIISNFHNQGSNEFLYAELKGDTLVLFNQAISNISVNGEGPVAADFRSINLNYRTDDGITLLDFNASYTR